MAVAFVKHEQQQTHDSCIKVKWLWIVHWPCVITTETRCLQMRAGFWSSARCLVHNQSKPQDLLGSWKHPGFHSVTKTWKSRWRFMLWMFGRSIMLLSFPRAVFVVVLTLIFVEEPLWVDEIVYLFSFPWCLYWQLYWTFEAIKEA